MPLVSDGVWLHLLDFCRYEYLQTYFSLSWPPHVFTKLFLGIFIFFRIFLLDFSLLLLCLFVIVVRKIYKNSEIFFRENIGVRGGWVVHKMAIFPFLLYVVKMSLPRWVGGLKKPQNTLT